MFADRIATVSRQGAGALVGALVLVAALASLALGASPAVARDAYVGLLADGPNNSDSDVAVIDTATNTSNPADNIGVGEGPIGIAITPDGKTAYVANVSSAGVVSVIDTQTNTSNPADDIAVGDSPRAIAIAPDGKTAYVTNSAGRNVSVVDTQTNTSNPADDIGVDISPDGVAITPDGKTAYVANGGGIGGGFVVSVIDTRTNSSNPADDIAVGTDADAVAISPDGRTGYVVNTGNNNVSVIDTQTNTSNPADDIAVGAVPGPIAIVPDQPPLASLAVSPASSRASAAGGASLVAEVGKPLSFDGSASSDPDGEIATYAWQFGDGKEAPNGGPTIKYAYAEPGTYTARLTLTDDEGCSTEFVYTGQTASCNGGAGASATADVRVEDGLEGLKLKVSKRLRGNRLKAKATCEAADCAATLRGNVRVKISGGASAAARPIKPRHADLTAGKQKTFKLKVKRRSRSALKRALRRGHNVNARVRGRAIDTFGNVEKMKAKVRLR